MRKILVIGDAMTDRYIFAETTRKSPEDPNVPIYDVKRVEDRPGGALNVAFNIDSISDNGFRVDLATILSKEQDYLKSARRWCVYTKFPIVKQRIVDQGTTKQVIRMDYHKQFDDASRKAFSLTFKENGNAYKLKADIDAVVVSDYCKGAIGPDVVKWLETLLVPVFVDTKDPDMSKWSKIYNCILKLNEKEWKAAKFAGSVRMIVTMGKNGSVYRPRDWHANDMYVPAPDIPNADVVGAGDAYLAGFVIGYLASHSKIDEAMSFATQVASASCRHFGTHIVSQQELKNEQLGYVRQSKVG